MTEKELIDKYAKQLAIWIQHAFKAHANMTLTISEEPLRNHLILFSEDLRNLEAQDQK